jgi:hypothetical protein
MEKQVINKDTVKIFEFVFNDGEKISIDGSAIKSFGLLGISWNTQRKADEDEISIYATVDKFYFVIDNAVTTNEETIRRLTNCNVYAINMVYTSGKVDEYYIRWDNDDTAFDKWQICEAFEDSFVFRRR